MEKIRMKCPRCGKRAFDISGLPSEQIEIELKCPNCHKIVSIPCIAGARLKTQQKGGEKNGQAYL